jgi:catechol 2,3-dioxygenase-like lactoylglutathione lyase family enzyme
MGIEGLSAVTLAVRDLARAEAFYRALGFAHCHGAAADGFVSLRAGGQYLNLQHRPDGAPPRGWGRAIFYVDDVDAQYRRALAAGIAPDFAPRDAPWGERYFHVADPDGHEISFARPLAR